MFHRCPIGRRFRFPGRHRTVVRMAQVWVYPERALLLCDLYEAARERGRALVACSTITQLAVISISPARHITVVKDGAGVDISGRERYCYCDLPRLLVSVGVDLSDVAPTGRRFRVPSTTQHRCQGWRRCGQFRRERYCCATRTGLLVSVGVDCQTLHITQLAVGSASPARHITVVEDAQVWVFPEESVVSVKIDPS